MMPQEKRFCKYLVVVDILALSQAGLCSTNSLQGYSSVGHRHVGAIQADSAVLFHVY